MAVVICEQQRGGHFLLISERLVFWNACGPSPHWQNSCVCVAAFAASQSLKGLKTCFSLSAVSTDRFKLVFRENALCPMESWEGSCEAPVMSWQMRAGLGVESAVLLSDG